MPTGRGKFNRRVTFQQRSLDDNGDRLGPWDEAGGFTRWARMQALKGGETVMQDRRQGVAPVIFTVLADGQTRQVTSAWRALFNGVAYNLSAPAPDEVNAEINFDAVAGQGDA